MIETRAFVTIPVSGITVGALKRLMADFDGYPDGSIVHFQVSS